MLSRRTVLVGGAAAVAAGGASFVELGPRKVLHAVGLVHSPDHHAPASGWPVVEHQLDSAAMKRSVSWAIATPPQAPTGVVICLHGRNNDHRLVFDTIRVHDAAAAAGVSVAVVGVDGGADSYWHKREDGTNALAMVTDELIPAVDAQLGAILPRIVLGWSMGGYGALLVAERKPALFAAAIAASPALWPTFAASSKGAFDDDADFERNDVFADVASLEQLVVRIDCGTDDGFVGEARRLAARLPQPNPGRFGDGFHDAAYWRSIAADQLATIRSVLAG